MSESQDEGCSEAAVVSSAPASALDSMVSGKPLPHALNGESAPSMHSQRQLPPTPPEVPGRPNHYDTQTSIQKPSAPTILTPRKDVPSRHNIAAGQYQNSPNSRPYGNMLPNGRLSTPSIRNLEQLVRKSNENQQHLEDILNELQLETTSSDKRPNREKPVAPRLPKRPSSQTSPRRRSSEEGTYLTLIRRDPSSSQQWNVANISDPPVYNVSSDSQRSKKSGQPMYLSITNPGYSKFAAENPSTPQLEDPWSSRTPSISSSDSTPPNDAPFQRRLWLEGSTMLHRKSMSVDSLSPALSPSGSTARLSMDSRPARITASGAPRSKAKSYTFVSPWGGRCEFGSGALGAALKCRAVGLAAAHPVPLSELRFNLPGSARRDGDDEEPPQSSVRLGPRSTRDVLLRREGRRSGIPDYDGEEDRLDLSLGQEAAGGGFGGKRAKLGKLIVEGEGFRMLDLLVAANMAVWWRAWDKV